MIPRYKVINKLIERYGYNNPEYLEIGVWQGDTFKFVNSNKKDGVDPGQYCECKLVNYKMTSDDFFKINTKKYDIVFIDGLHTAYQVSKDIFNSVKCLNNNGVIILDDVYPHNEKEQEALDLTKSGAQTGDVWKAVYEYLDTIIDISSEVLFVDNTERGSLIFRIKNNDVSLKEKLIINDSIPKVNTDGWYKGNDKEWNKYIYSTDFNSYLSKLQNYKWNLN